MKNFESYFLEHWITQRQQTLTGWLTTTNTFIKVISNHGTKQIVKQMDASLIDDPERIKKLILSGNVRVVDIHDKIMLTANSAERAKSCVRYICRNFPSKTDNKHWIANIINKHNNTVIEVSIDPHTFEITKNIF